MRSVDHGSSTRTDILPSQGPILWYKLLEALLSCGVPNKKGALFRSLYNQDPLRAPF